MDAEPVQADERLRGIRGSFGTTAKGTCRRPDEAATSLARTIQEPHSDAKRGEEAASRRKRVFADSANRLLQSHHGMCRFSQKGGDPMSSRLLSIAAVVAFSRTSGAALACTGPRAKSADGSQQQSIPIATQARGG